MKFYQAFLLSVCAVFSAYGIGFDVFKEAGDVRPVTFTIPVQAGGKEVKWAAKAGDKAFSPPEKISFVPSAFSTPELYMLTRTVSSKK